MVDVTLLSLSDTLTRERRNDSLFLVETLLTLCIHILVSKFKKLTSCLSEFSLPSSNYHVCFITSLEHLKG